MGDAVQTAILLFALLFGMYLAGFTCAMLMCFRLGMRMIRERPREVLQLVHEMINEAEAA